MIVVVRGKYVKSAQRRNCNGGGVFFVHSSVGNAIVTVFINFKRKDNECIIIFVNH